MSEIDENNLKRLVLAHVLGTMDDYEVASETGLTYYQRGYFQAWALVGQMVEGLMTFEQQVKLVNMREETKHDPARPRPDRLLQDIKKLVSDSGGGK